MKDYAREYLNEKLHNAMADLNFQNWIIKEFLLDILMWQIDAKSERSVFSPRKESAVGTRILGADASPEVLNILGKRMLFVLGFFPEHLVATGKRTVGVRYYFNLERTLVSRLAPYFEPWQMVDRHFQNTVRSLNYVRLSVHIQKPEPNFFYQLQKIIQDCE